MAKLTLLDLAKRSGSDPVIGLVEEILTVAPELQALPVVPKPGTSYSITRRTGKPRGAFRSANEGLTPGKSTYEQIVVPMFFFDGQMEVDEAIVKADDRRLGDILAQEGAGQLQDNYVVLGDQIYRGQTADAKGFKGFKESVDATMVVDATGTGAATHTAWAIYENERDGLHLPIGNDGAMNLGPWNKQQITDDNGKKLMAWVNNLSFYIGLALGSSKCIGCVKNITTAKPLTDALGAELANKFPVGRKPTRWLISRDATFLLQKSRTAIGQVATDAKGGQGFAPRPTELAGTPIVETDSIATIAAW
jgi:hypothetical protein